MSDISIRLITEHSVAIAEIIEIPLSKFGATAKFCSFTDLEDAKEHLLIIIGNPDVSDAPLARIHSECLRG